MVSHLERLRYVVLDNAEPRLVCRPAWAQYVPPNTRTIEKGLDDAVCSDRKNGGNDRSAITRHLKAAVQQWRTCNFIGCTDE